MCSKNRLNLIRPMVLSYLIILTISVLTNSLCFGQEQYQCTDFFAESWNNNIAYNTESGGPTEIWIDEAKRLIYIQAEEILLYSFDGNLLDTTKSNSNEIIIAFTIDKHGQAYSLIKKRQQRSCAILQYGKNLKSFKKIELKNILQPNTPVTIEITEQGKYLVGDYFGDPLYIFDSNGTANDTEASQNVLKQGFVFSKGKYFIKHDPESDMDMLFSVDHNKLIARLEGLNTIVGVDDHKNVYIYNAGIINKYNARGEKCAVIPLGFTFSYPAIGSGDGKQVYISPQGNVYAIPSFWNQKQFRIVVFRKQQDRGQ